MMAFGIGVDAVAVAVLGAVTLQRLAELAYSRRNETWLRARGAIDVSARLERGRVIAAELVADQLTSVELSGPGLPARTVNLRRGSRWRLV